MNKYVVTNTLAKLEKNGTDLSIVIEGISSVPKQEVAQEIFNCMIDFGFGNVEIVIQCKDAEDACDGFLFEESVKIIVK